MQAEMRDAVLSLAYSLVGMAVGAAILVESSRVAYVIVFLVVGATIIILGAANIAISGALIYLIGTRPKDRLAGG